jgi:biopolymer transport protein ExbB
MDRTVYRQDEGPPGRQDRFPRNRSQIVTGILGLILSLSITMTCQAQIETTTSAPNSDSFFRTDTLLYQFVISGGPIVWYILFPMSIWTLVRGIELSILIRRKRLLPSNAGAEIVAMAAKLDPAVLTARFVNAKDLVRRSIHRALIQTRQSSTHPRQLEHVATEALHEQAMGLLRKAELCNIFGNVAPMVGLFGTVVGMIQAFNHLGISQGQPRPDQLAIHISVALVTTFWGLLIAIPALSIHGIFRTRLESLVSEAAMEIETVLRQIRLPVMTGLTRPVSTASPAMAAVASKDKNRPGNATRRSIDDRAGENPSRIKPAES